MTPSTQAQQVYDPALLLPVGATLHWRGSTGTVEGHDLYAQDGCPYIVRCTDGDLLQLDWWKVDEHEDDDPGPYTQAWLMQYPPEWE